MASTIVVIIGTAITAGSNPNFFAQIGSNPPIMFDEYTVKISASNIVKATLIPSLEIINTLNKITKSD